MTRIPYDRPRRREAAREGWRQRRRAGYVPRGRDRPHARDRAGALALAYRVQQLPRWRFDQVFDEYCERIGKRPYARRRDALWARYVCCWRNYRVRGQGFPTTNARGLRALELAGEPRCRRTLQYLDAELAAMGLVRRAHVKRNRDVPGRRDYLRVQISTYILHPASGSTSSALRALAAGAPRPLAERVRAPCGRKRERPPPAAAANGGDEGIGSGAQLALPLAQQAHGFAEELERLVAELGPDALARLQRPSVPDDEEDP